MSKSVIAALITGIFAAILAWVTAYLALPLWITVLFSALFFTAPRSDLAGLLMTLLTALLGVLFGVLWIKGLPYLPNFPYQDEIIIGIVVFALYLITRTGLLNYFSGTLVGLSVIILMNGNWIIVCQTVVLGVLFGFISKLLCQLLAKESVR